ncbi:myosin-2 heavy chain [Eupeodes corollae]|uniref:myosin-2 heavy chain n=1 Tax=Eupeodes corollae TaxID=290404 RepID=UPI0024927D5B|nr:myosin-2 heavy chain [Eupeodes corollae]
MGSSESSLPMDEGESSSETTNNHPEELSQDSNEDPWWWEIENQNLLLNVADGNEAPSESGPSTSASAIVRTNNNGIVTITSEQKLIHRRSKSPKDSIVSDLPDEGASESLVFKSDEIEQDNEVNSRREQSLEEFKEELKTKRMARQTAVNDLREELKSLRRQLAEERGASRRSRSVEGNSEEVQPTSCSSEEAKKKQMEESDRAFAQQISDDEVVSESTNPKVQLAEAQLALQMANAENLSLQTELGVTRKQVVSLKEVVTCCKQMIAMKEEQVVQLKDKLNEIEDSLAERELKIMSDNLRQEYDRQLANMRTLRQLYEERARVSAAERENLERQISIKKDELEVEKEKTKNVEERNAGLEKELENAAEELRALKEQCNEHKFENKTLKEEMGAVNKLFSQMLMGFNGTNNLDIDRLTTMLEENRTLLNDMATKEANFDGATLPKLLFELVQQAAVANIKPSETESSLSLLAPTAATAADAGAAGQTNRDDEEEDESSCDITKYCSGLTATASEAVSVESPHPSSASAVPSLSSAPTTVCGMPTTEANISSNGNVEQTARGGHKTTNNTTATTNNDESLHEYENDDVKHQQRLEHYHPNAKQQGGNLDHNQPRVIAKVASAEEIIGNLPKVWKVLMELLSHHKIERVQFKENGHSEDCFKSVQTPNGPKAELSVSKTYIKLKDLILEKKSLVKETNRLKTLNCHLDYRLNEQEKRLSAVSLELQKTWHLVGKMQRQHRQLHTQEQILRYQLQQKRRLLSELKDELEYCRRKWAAARAKNDESQLQCDDLRREFAKRKLEDAHNSAESGYSDGPGSDEDDAVVSKEAANTKNLADLFEIKKTIQRMQSTSPERSGFYSNEELRWNSAPPAVKWPKDDSLLLLDDEPCSSVSASGSGAISKKGPRISRTKKRGSIEENIDHKEESPDGDESDRATRIHRLEEQCKSLIAAVIETSDNRERLEVQLCHFQDEIAPTQYPIPLEEYMANKAIIERMKRASSAPEINENKIGQACLTAREEEYTRKRSERLERLEEESRQLMNRIKRTSDKGNSLRSSIERIHSRRVLSREGSFESNTEEVAAPEEIEIGASEACGSMESNVELNIKAEPEFSAKHDDSKLLTETERDYTARRAERLKRLEEESKLLLSKLTKNSDRGTTFNTKLDALHEKYGSEERETPSSSSFTTSEKIENRLENVAKMSTNREERLRILEEEGRQLLSKLSKTSDRGSQMIDRLSEREKNKNLKASLEQDKDDHPEILSEPAIPPTLKNVACTSIVSEEITERVVITQTPSQIAQSQGAVPKAAGPQFSEAIETNRPEKSQPTAKLCASTGRKRVAVPKTDTASESLEEMVKRLKNLPFPGESEANQPTSDSKK